MSAPALYEVTVRHTRVQRIRRTLRHRGYLWLVDLDDLPALSRWLAPFARFDASDHCGDPGRAIRSNVDTFLAGHGVDLGGGRVLMLAGAKVLGYVFNPLTVYWCHRAGGELACVIAEVHNTYRGRHRYLLFPDAGGTATTAKTFYVSPFLDVAGHYRLRLPVPGDRLVATIALHQDGCPAFVATMHGRRHDATPASLLRLLLRYPLAPHRVATAIRRHGITLWLRGLPIVARAEKESRR